MLMKPDAKQLASLIVGKEGEIKEEPTNEKGEIIDSDIPMQAAADELLSAIETKDSAGIVEAIKSMIEMCSHKDV